MRKIKVLYINNGDGIGGGSIALLNIITELKEEVECEVVFPRQKGDFSRMLEERGVKCHHFRFAMNLWPNRKLGLLKWLKMFIYWSVVNTLAPFRLMRIIKKFKPDIIHSNVGPINLGHHAALWCGIPHVWHLREYEDKDFDMHPYPSFKSQVKKFHHRNNHCIAITDGVFSHFGLGDKDIRIYDGVIPDYQQDAGLKKNYFLFAGRLQDAKGSMALLIAYDKYVLTGGQSELWYAGAATKEYADSLNAYIREHGLIEKVKLLGFRKDVYDLMSSAKALFVPSRFEGFGFITTEAMYNHCLVVGRNTGGTKEQFDNGLKMCGKEIGIRFEHDDEIPTLMHNVDKHDYTEMTSAAYDVVTSMYTIKKNAAEVLKYYRTILQTKQK